MIYVDLDGVLVDMSKGVYELTGSTIDYFYSTNPGAMWKRLAYTKDFFANLDWTSDGKELWNAIKHLNPTILTGVPWGNWAPRQKKEWCARELGGLVPVITGFSRNKANHCKVGDILIDDKKATKALWEEAGGIYILHTSTKDSIKQMKELGIV